MGVQDVDGEPLDGGPYVKSLYWLLGGSGFPLPSGALLTISTPASHI